MLILVSLELLKPVNSGNEYFEHQSGLTVNVKLSLSILISTGPFV